MPIGISPMYDDFSVLGAATLRWDGASQSLPGGFSLTRASVGTYTNSSGVITTAAVDEARFDYNPVTLQPLGLLLEGARTNLLLNSATLSTQSVTVSATAYALSFYGTGTVTLSGTSSGSLVGSGAYPTRSVLKFTPTAGTLTLTVTGSVQFAQLEAGDFETSYIPTAGASATRATELTTAPSSSLGFNAAEGTLLIELNEAIPTSHNNVGEVIARFQNPGSVTDAIGIQKEVGGQNFRAFVANASTYTYSSYGGFGNTKLAVAYKASSCAYYAGGSPITWSSPSSIPSNTDLFRIGSDSSGTSHFFGHIRKITYWPQRLANAQLAAITS